MYLDDPRKLYACFRCGEIAGDIKTDETSGLHYCGSCGEHGLVYLQTALDMLNEMFLAGHLKIKEREDFDIEDNYNDE